MNFLKKLFGKTEPSPVQETAPIDAQISLSDFRDLVINKLNE